MSRFFRKTRVLSKLVANVAYAKILKKRRPIFLGLYITNTCNLRCTYCFHNVEDRYDDKSRPDPKTLEIFRQVDEMYDLGTRWIFLLGGEPLVHKDIGKIVKYITDKGILLHIFTNGIMVPKRFEQIKSADGVAISVDGGEEATDVMRGKGAFKRAFEAAEICVKAGMQTRVHAVINKHSFNDMEFLAKKCQKVGCHITLSPLNSIGDGMGQKHGGNDPSLRMSKDQYKEFYRLYRKLKTDGYPISNSLYSIDKAATWPTDYHKWIQREGINGPDEEFAGYNVEEFAGYKQEPCVIGYTHGCIDSEGTMFNCIQRGVLDGQNIHDVGIKNAWDALPEFRKDCNMCSSMNTIETAAYMNLRKEILMEGVKFFFGRKPKPSSLSKSSQLSMNVQ